MNHIALPLPEVLDQDQVWIHGEALEDMDPHHRRNLIPFLRGNKQRLYLRAHPDRPVGTPQALSANAEEWLARTPLMRRLCELEAGRPIDERRATAERNAAFEKATGYRKVREPQLRGGAL
jgi:hypothetical protein